MYDRAAILMPRFFGVLLIYVCLAPLDNSFAEMPQNFSPASFDTGLDDFIGNKITLPNIEGDVSLLIRCESRVSRSGRMSKNNCFALNNAERNYAVTIEKAADKSRVKPATIDGKATKVWFEYAVRIIREEHNRSAQFYPNWGINFSNYGTDYISAQPYTIWEWPRQCWWPDEPFFVLVSVLVISDGTAKDAEVYASGDSASSECTAAFKKLALGRNYVPAFVNGKPVDAQFLEPWFRMPGRPDLGPYDILMPVLESDTAY